MIEKLFQSKRFKDALTRIEKLEREIQLLTQEIFELNFPKGKFSFEKIRSEGSLYSGFYNGLFFNKLHNKKIRKILITRVTKENELNLEIDCELNNSVIVRDTISGKRWLLDYDMERSIQIDSREE